jgi:hypothetical protein
MTTIITGMNGPSYQFSTTPTTFGPWNQILHVDTTPYHFHMGHTMYYFKSPPLFYNQVRPLVYRLPRRIY